MKRYADVDAIVEEMDRYIEHFTKLGIVVDGNDCFYKIRELLADAPTADMVEVVRCKDCKWYKKIVEKSKSGLCHYDLVARCLHDEDYCSHGERRE